MVNRAVKAKMPTSSMNERNQMINRPSQLRIAARRAGFTLVEMLVVVTVLVIMTSMIVPRLVGNDKRQFKLAVEKVGDLLTMYAQRQNLSEKVVGIYHDRQNNWIELMIIDTDNNAPGQVADWRIDNYVQPVKLPSFMVDTDVDFFVDGDRYDASYIPLSSDPGQERPQIQIALRGAGENAMLTLFPYGVAPELTSTWENTQTARTPVDLDGAGRSREDW